MDAPATSSDESEDGISSPQEALLKNLSMAIQELEESPKPQRPLQNIAIAMLETASHISNTTDDDDEMNTNSNHSSTSKSNKRPRYQRRNSFVVRRDGGGGHNMMNNYKHRPTLTPNALLEDEWNKSAPNLFSPKPMPSSGSGSGAAAQHAFYEWGNSTWSNEDDTDWYRLSTLSFDSEPIIPSPTGTTSTLTRNRNLHRAENFAAREVPMFDFNMRSPPNRTKLANAAAAPAPALPGLEEEIRRRTATTTLDSSSSSSSRTPSSPRLFPRSSPSLPPATHRRSENETME
jgi:hypothetical protein